MIGSTGDADKSAVPQCFLLVIKSEGGNRRE